MSQPNHKSHALYDLLQSSGFYNDLIKALNKVTPGLGYNLNECLVEGRTRLPLRIAHQTERAEYARPVHQALYQQVSPSPPPAYDDAPQRASII